MREGSAGHVLTGASRLLALSAAAWAMTGVGLRAAEHLPPGAASCSACHAADDASAPPPLSNLSADEITAALAAYRSGKREGTLMPRLAQGFSEAEARAIAAAVGRGGQGSR